MLLTKWCLNNPVAVTLLYTILVVVGLVALLTMGRSILPPVAFPVISIRAIYPGAGAKELEHLVVEPIEEQLATLPDVERVHASAQNGVAALRVQFRFGSNIDVDRENVRQAVSDAQPNLPRDLVPPAVAKDDPSQAPVLEESIGSAILSPRDVSRIVDRTILPALRSSSAIGSVTAAGGVATQFTIRPKATALAALGATPLDLLRAVGQANDVLPGGSLQSPEQESTIGIRAAAATKAELEQIPLSTASSAVRLRDVATVETGIPDPSVIARVDDEPSELLLVGRAPGADAIRAIASAQKTFARLSADLPLVRFEELRSDRPYTDAAIGGVLQTLGEGIVLTVCVMLLFLHAWRNALIAAISIPTSLCAAFVAMWSFGFTINVLSLMGLSLTIGILVDDSIVIIEAIVRNAKRAGLPDEAALAGRRELGGAAFAITLVDVAVFAPIALMSGLVGEFMREFGLVIVFATGFSLLVSLTLTPLLAARWALRDRGEPLEDLSRRRVAFALRERARTLPWTFRTPVGLALLTVWHAWLNGFNSWIDRTASWYADRALPWVFARKTAAIATAIVACVASLVSIGWIPTEFSPPLGRGETTVDVTFPAGTPLQVTDARVRRVANAILDDPSVKHVTLTAGRALNAGSEIISSNVAELGIVLADPNATGDAVLQRVKELGYLVPSAAITGGGTGMGGLPPIAYSVGGDPASIDRGAAAISGILARNASATDIRTTNGGLGPHLQIDVDAGRARMLGVSLDDAAQTARIATGGSIAMKTRTPDALLDVVVRSQDISRASTAALERYAVRSIDGRLVPLSDVTTRRWTSEPKIIERENGERIVTVSANVVPGAAIGSVTSAVAREVRALGALPRGTRIESRGDAEQFIATLQRILAALALSIVGVYAILAILYRSYALPLVVMLSVPLASIGAFGILAIFNVLHAAFPGVPAFQNQTLNLYSMLGVVMLVGLVAKNGVLLVEYAERNVRGGSDAYEAIRSAARVRLRPILMTTFAMIAGMLPLAIGETIGAEYRKALGSVVIGGLASSLALTLFLVPLGYVMVRNRSLRRRKSADAVFEAR